MIKDRIPEDKENLIEIELGEINLTDTIISLTDLIITCNCTKRYSTTIYNCQHFMEDMITSLGIEKMYTEKISKFLY
jgi:hypothetical protein